MYFRRSSVMLVLVVALLELSSLTIAFAPPKPQLFMAPKMRAGPHTSYNWAGYAVTGPSSSVTYVKGSWKVPAVTSTPIDTYAAFWVGIDGYGSNTVEQIGVDCEFQNGVAVYYAWYEFYPKLSYVISSLIIHPDDVMWAEVKYVGGAFTVSMTDATTGQSFSKSETATSAQRSSAEWIAEAPYSGGILPLANFGTAYFGYDFTSVSLTCYANISGTTGPIGSFGSMIQQITMVSSTGEAIAQPSSLSGDGTSFSVQRVKSPKALLVSVSTDKTSYTINSTVHLQIKVTDSSTGISIPGATVKITLIEPNGTTVGGTVTTNSNGVIYISGKIGRNYPTGTYGVKASASVLGYNTANGSALFQVG